MSQIAIDVQADGIESAFFEMSTSEAQTVTDNIKRSGGEFSSWVSRAYYGQAWKALGYASWKDYVEQACHITRQRAFQLVQFEDVRAEVSTIVDADGDVLPEREAQTRALAKAPQEKRRTVWKEARKRAGGKQPTAKTIEAVIADGTEPMSQMERDRARELNEKIKESRDSLNKLGDMLLDHMCKMAVAHGGNVDPEMLITRFYVERLTPAGRAQLAEWLKTL